MDYLLVLAADPGHAPAGTSGMNEDILFYFYIFALALFAGYVVISKVPALLHTPLMAFTNAVAGISLVASIVMAGGDYGATANWLGFVAVTCATINVVGGFLITDRMLKMFRKKGGEQ